MSKLFSKLLLLAGVLLLAVSCSDEEEGTEFLFDREVMELSVLQSCADENDTSACYRLRFRLPYEKEHLAYIHVWLDTTVIDDTSKAVTSKQIEKATKSISYGENITKLYDTLDLTELVQEYLDTSRLFRWRCSVNTTMTKTRGLSSARFCVSRMISRHPV